MPTGATSLVSPPSSTKQQAVVAGRPPAQAANSLLPNSGSSFSPHARAVSSTSGQKADPVEDELEGPDRLCVGSPVPSMLKAPSPPPSRSGSLSERVGFNFWKSRPVELKFGTLRWWLAEEDFRQHSPPFEEIRLVSGNTRWRVQPPKEDQFELLRHTGPGWPAPDCAERHVLKAADAQEALSWVRAIAQHTGYLETLLSWPFSPEGRQGQVQDYPSTPMTRRREHSAS